MQFKSIKSIVLIIVLPAVILGSIVVLLAAKSETPKLVPATATPLIISPTSLPIPFLDVIIIGLTEGSTCTDAEEIAMRIGGKVKECIEEVKSYWAVTMEIPPQETPHDLQLFTDKLREMGSPYIRYISTITRRPSPSIIRHPSP